MRYGVKLDEHLIYNFVDLHSTEGCLSCISHYRNEQDAREEAESYQKRGYEHDPYASFRERRRDENHADLVIANERRLVQSGDLSVESTLSYSELRRLERATRGESLRTAE